MSDHPILRALQRLGLRLDGQFQFKFGSGVTPKTAGTVIVGVIGIVAAGIWMPEGPSKLPVVIGLMVLLAFFLLGTWIHTALNPHSPLEGGHLLAWHQATLGAKGLQTAEETAVISSEEYRALEKQAVQTEGGGNGA
jgi:hypothetical protein